MNHVIAIGTPHFASENTLILEVRRKSGNTDSFICVAENIDIASFTSASKIEISGEINFREKAGHQEMYISILDAIEHNPDEHYENSVMLRGIICRRPYHKRVCNNKASLTSTILKVGSTYVPVIFWGTDAKRCKRLPNGTEICVEGRLQSRIYTKHMDTGNVEKGITYEVSVNEMLII
jgi:hypothetical protein